MAPGAEWCDNALSERRLQRLPYGPPPRRVRATASRARLPGLGPTALRPRSARMAQGFTPTSTAIASRSAPGHGHS